MFKEDTRQNVRLGLFEPSVLVRLGHLLDLPLEKLALLAVVLLHLVPRPGRRAPKGTWEVERKPAQSGRRGRRAGEVLGERESNGARKQRKRSRPFLGENRMRLEERITQKQVERKAGFKSETSHDCGAHLFSCSAEARTDSLKGR